MQTKLLIVAVLALLIATFNITIGIMALRDYKLGSRTSKDTCVIPLPSSTAAARARAASASSDKANKGEPCLYWDNKSSTCYKSVVDKDGNCNKASSIPAIALISTGGLLLVFAIFLFYESSHMYE